MTFNLDCPPYVPPQSGRGTILELAARARADANVYRVTVDQGCDYVVTLRAASALARATEALTSAIADAVACGDNSLS